MTILQYILYSKWRVIHTVKVWQCSEKFTQPNLRFYWHMFYNVSVSTVSPIQTTKTLSYITWLEMLSTTFIWKTSFRWRWSPCLNSCDIFLLIYSLNKHNVHIYCMYFCLRLMAVAKWVSSESKWLVLMCNTAY